MPTYSYECKECHHQLEAMQSMKDEPLKTCPSCKKDALNRGPGGGLGLVFKGSGYYITDYASNKEAPKKDCGKPFCACK